MIIDKQTTLSDAQLLTTTAASTNIYDAGKQGDAIGKNLWVVVRVNVKLDSSSHTGTLTVQLETADDSSFSTNKVILIGPATALAATSLAAGTILMKAQIPIGMRQYVRLTYTNAVEAFNAGSVDAFIVDTVDDQLSF